MERSITRAEQDAVAPDGWRNPDASAGREFPLERAIGAFEGVELTIHGSKIDDPGMERGGMSDGTIGAMHPDLGPGVDVPGVETAGVGAQKGEIIAHDDFHSGAGQFLPEFLAPGHAKRAGRKVGIKTGSLQIPAQGGPIE